MQIDRAGREREREREREISLGLLCAPEIQINWFKIPNSEPIIHSYTSQKFMSLFLNDFFQFFKVYEWQTYCPAC
jgi:hypothetical protein